MATQHDFLDRYSRLNSPIHRLPAGVKLACALAILLAIVMIPIHRSHGFLPVVAALAGIAGLSRIPLGFLMKRLLVLEPFVLGVAMLAFFQPDGTERFLFIVIRSTLCLFTAILLSNTTPFAGLLAVLRRLRMPALLVTTLALMYRYAFLVIDEMDRLRHAKASRTFSKDHRRARHLLAVTAGQLLVRSNQRAGRIYAAMCARGWK